MAEKIRVLLYGLGAIGSFYAFILSRSTRVRLSVVARSNYEAVKSKGLVIKSQNHGDHIVRPANVFKTPAEAKKTFDFIVCAHKAVNQGAVPDQLAPVVDESKTTIVLMQNGVGNEEPFRKAFPKAKILSGVVWVGATQVSPGVVEHTKSENTEIGIYHNDALSDDEQAHALDQFTSLLKEGGTPFDIKSNIQLARWEKVVWNVAWNSLTTLTSVDTQSWLHSSPDAKRLTRRLMQEVVDVGRKCGVPLEDELIDQLFARILAMPGIYSSMYQDCKHGRPMEVEVILGTPVRKARELGIPVPTLEIIYAMLLAINGRIEQGK